MKKIIFATLCCTLGLQATAQLVKPSATTPQLKQSEADWYNCSFDKDKVYGAEVNKAYDFLQSHKKKVQKNPIIALIGPGIDVEHEDVRQSIWTNRKEKADGKDNDKNGLTDDINGWNFLGGKDNQYMETTLSEGNKEFFRLKDKYGKYIFDGKKYYKIIDGKRQEVPAPEDMAEYTYYRYKVMPESKLAGKYAGAQLAYVIEEYANKFNKDLQQRFPNKELTLTEFQTCYDPKAEKDSLSDVSYMMLAYGFTIYNTEKWETVYERMGKGYALFAEKEYEEELKKHGTDYRKEIVGDNPYDLSDNIYGNNVLLTSDATTGILAAGIMAAKRGNGIGIDGIADHAQIMTLRTNGMKGEPYLKDVTLAIKYAIRHNADIIIMPRQGSLYPPMQRKWIADALKEAEKKGILVIVPIWDLSVDMDKNEFFPNRNMGNDGELTNLMVVASSDKKGNPILNTNYGAKSVDLYAPGADIYTTYMGDSYRMATGEELAVATVAGVAALLKTYFPKLTGSQIRDILIKSVTSRKGEEVEKGILVNGSPSQDLFLFEDLCISGGIINAYQAVLEAEKLTK